MANFSKLIEKKADAAPSRTQMVLTELYSIVDSSQFVFSPRRISCIKRRQWGFPKR